MPAISFLLLLFLFAGCVSYSHNSDNRTNYSGPQNGPAVVEPTDTFSGSSGEGVETWLATISVNEDDQIVTAMSEKTDPTSTENEKSHATIQFQGSFPIKVQHTKDSATGGDVYQLVYSGEDYPYPVTGSYQSIDHIDYTNGETGVHRMAFQHQEIDKQGSISTTNFDMGFYSDYQMVQVDTSFPITSKNTEVFSEPEYNLQETTADTYSPWYQCHSTTSDTDDFTSGTHDFHRDGAKYVINCQATIVQKYTDDEDNHYDPSSQSTRDITLKVTLDPSYVPLQTLNPV